MVDVVEQDESSVVDGGRPVVVVGVLSVLLSAGATVALLTVTVDELRFSGDWSWSECWQPGARSASAGPLLASWPATAGLLVLGAAVLAVTAARWSPSPWAFVPTAAVGLVGVVAGTGVGRPLVVVDVDYLEGSYCNLWLGPRTSWAWMVLGGAVCAVALMLGVYRRRLAGRGWAAVAVLVLGVLGAGGIMWLSTLVDRVQGASMISGRPVRDRGRRRSAPAGVAGSGCQWARAAMEEHVAAAAFEAVARDLARLAAPAHLVARCRSAAEDECRHARRCLALAGQPGASLPDVAAPVATPGEARTAALVRVALEAHADGVVNEGRAAAELRRTAVRLRASGEVARANVVDGIAADEERHAALNGDIVRWCRSELRGPADVLVRALT